MRSLAEGLGEAIDLRRVESGHTTYDEWRSESTEEASQYCWVVLRVLCSLCAGAGMTEGEPAK